MRSVVHLTMRILLNAALLAVASGCSSAAPVTTTPLGPTYAPRPSDAEVLLFSVRAPECPYQEVALLTAYPDPALGVSRADAVESLKRRVRKLGGDAIVGMSQVSGGVNGHGGITGTAIRFTDPGCNH